jgi:segregation and condensation protein A
VIAARLVLIKSRALLPQTPVLPDSEEEEDPGEALVRQLQRYKRFKQSAVWLHQRQENGLRTYLRVAPPPKLEGMLDLTGITVETLITAVRAALERVGERDDSVSLARPRRITIEGKIRELRRRLKGQEVALFKDLLSRSASRMEVAITLLAVLELIKRREVVARQTAMFGPIEIVTIGEMSPVATGA